MTKSAIQLKKFSIFRITECRNHMPDPLGIQEYDCWPALSLLPDVTKAIRRQLRDERFRHLDERENFLCPAKTSILKILCASGCSEVSVDVKTVTGRFCPSEQINVRDGPHISCVKDPDGKAYAPCENVLFFSY